MREKTEKKKEQWRTTNLEDKKFNTAIIISMFLLNIRVKNFVVFGVTKKF